MSCKRNPKNVHVPIIEPHGRVSESSLHARGRKQRVEIDFGEKKKTKKTMW